MIDRLADDVAARTRRSKELAPLVEVNGIDACGKRASVIGAPGWEERFSGDPARLLSTADQRKRPSRLTSAMKNRATPKVATVAEAVANVTLDGLDLGAMKSHERTGSILTLAMRGPSI